MGDGALLYGWYALQNVHSTILWGRSYVAHTRIRHTILGLLYMC